MTLEEAAAQGMTGMALIVWIISDKNRKKRSHHAQVNSNGLTVCGKPISASKTWRTMSCSYPELARRVAFREDLCSQCIRQIAKYDFSPGKEPSRNPKTFRAK